MKELIQNAHRNKNDIATGEAEIHFFAEVEFGAPSNNCQNYGICRLDLIKESFEEQFIPKHSCGKVYLAQVSYFESHQISIKFLKSNLGEQAIQKYFGSDWFKVDENFHTIVQLNPSAEKKFLSINKGQYPILKNDKNYIVRFF